MRPCPWPCGASKINYTGIREGSLAQAEASWSVAAGTGWCFLLGNGSHSGLTDESCVLLGAPSHQKKELWEEVSTFPPGRMDRRATRSPWRPCGGDIQSPYIQGRRDSWRSQWIKTPKGVQGHLSGLFLKEAGDLETRNTDKVEVL